MPIYEYKCSDCGHQQEYLQKVSDPPQTVCPACGKATFSKMLSAAGFQLKGSGWYATDFKSSGSKPAAKPTSGESGKSEAKSESKSEAKSESKKDSGGTPSATGGSSPSNG